MRKGRKQMSMRAWKAAVRDMETCLRDGGDIAAVAAKHGVTASYLYRVAYKQGWRRVWLSDREQRETGEKRKAAA
jgi:transposase-like protein